MFINTLIEEKITVKALIDTSSKFNTISESLFDKLKEDYGIHDPVENLYGDVIDEIKCLDLQFRYICDEVKIDTHSLQYQSSPLGLLLIPEKAVYLYP
ncbi:15590_t:CDS:2 [Cetraspora pellucida]|uniref:15590_t:CDS:1 n=1 Tax=Cetraspora pellucida TaxID=1433469 RepID=A0ACA9LBX9_9GLOM|nr:15590_t:CDS:2 [Cetraspora pellucida]